MADFERKIKTRELLSTNSNYIKELFDKTEYAWEVLPLIKGHIAYLISSGKLEGFSEISEGVFVGEGVKIARTAVIEPPAIIGANTEIRPGAYLRGNVIAGEGCVIGNSAEIKNAVLSDRAQVPHYNYVGDSVLGYHAHMGAGSICSNLKLDGTNVKVKLDTVYETGLRKFGAILGDNTDVGCNCVLNPGTVIGKNTAVYPLTSVRGVLPENCIVKNSGEIAKKK